MFRSALICALLALSAAAQAQSYPTPTFNDVITSTDVRFYGADPTGATDSTAAITTAVASGKNLYFPPGTYNFASMSLTGNQRVSCSAPGKTILAQNSTTGDFITMSGQYNSIQHCQLQPSVRVSGYQIVVTVNCFQCSVIDAWINNHYNTILSNQKGMLTLRDILVGSMYGKFGVTFIGTSATHANNLFMYNVLFNNAYPYGYSTVPVGQPFVVSWAPNTAFTTGQVMKNAANEIYQEATQSCTSASTGTGPAGFPPGTTPVSVFFTNIPDGTCNWRYVSNGFIGLNWSNYANTVTAYDFVVLNNLEAVKMTDNVNPPGQNAFVYPSFGNFVGLVGDHTFWATFDGEGGGQVQLTNVYACSSLALANIQTGGNFLGDLKVIGGQACNAWLDGINLQAGQQFTISGVAANSNSRKGASLAVNIEVGAGISDFSITNNKLGLNVGAGSGGNWAKWGVAVDAGASDYYVITGNTCSGNVQTACIADVGTGTHKTVSGNW